MFLMLMLFQLKVQGGFFLKVFLYFWVIIWMVFLLGFVFVFFKIMCVVGLFLVKFRSFFVCIVCFFLFSFMWMFISVILSFLIIIFCVGFVWLMFLRLSFFLVFMCQWEKIVILYVFLIVGLYLQVQLRYVESISGMFW